MASAITHAVVAAALVKIAFPRNPGARCWLLAIFCAVVPDADALGYALGVPYESVWGHRGFTHSLLFAGLLALAVVGVYRRSRPPGFSPLTLWAFFFVVTASHAILDAMTTGGLGVAFFAPFSDARYFFPLRPIRVSPISVTRFFSGRGLAVLASEVVWVWLPAFMAVAIASIVRKRPARLG